MKKGKGYQLQFSRQQGVDRGGGGLGTGVLIGEGGVGLWGIKI